jgi:uncharacterized OB-fold protein
MREAAVIGVGMTRFGVSEKTSIEMFAEGFESPYIVGIVKLDEGPWLMGNIIGVDCNEATMDLIGRRVKLGHAVIPGDKFSAGERVAATFSLEE